MEITSSTSNPPPAVANGEEDASSPHRAALEKLFTRISEVSTLPTVVTRIIELADDEFSNVSDLLQAIEGDPALAARVLRRVNSSYYGLRNKVADLRSAVSLLGLLEIRGLALTVYVSRMFQEGGDFLSYSREGLWNHSLGVAMIARHVSRVCDCAVPDEAYLAGLLHDIGLILLDQRLRKHFCVVIEKIDEQTPTSQIEREILTFDHADLGAFVSDRWNFPEQIVAAIRHHHHPTEYEGSHQELVYVIAVANYLCTRAGCTSTGVSNVYPPADTVYAGLELAEDKLSKIWEVVQESLSANSGSLI